MSSTYFLLLLTSNSFGLVWFDRVLNCGLKLQSDGFGLDTEIGILSYLAFIQDAQLKSVLNDMVRVRVYSFECNFTDRSLGAIFFSLNSFDFPFRTRCTVRHKLIH